MSNEIPQSNHLIGQTGFSGKLPSHGDFVTRNLPNDFLTPWNEWLQAVIAVSQEQLENLWLDIYLTSPLWRFAASANSFGPNGVIGILMPSVDRVGRYFPLVIAQQTTLPTVQALCEIEEWYDQAETLILSTLNDDFSFDSFTEQVEQLGELLTGKQPPVFSPLPAPQYSYQTPQHSRRTLSLDIPIADTSHHPYTGLLQALINRNFPETTLWWTNGSERIAPTLLMCEGPPPLNGFAAMLDGSWDQWGWPRDRILAL